MYCLSCGKRVLLGKSQKLIFCRKCKKKHLEFKYDPKKDREIESELNNLKGRIQTLERFLKTDKEKLKKLKEKN